MLRHLIFSLLLLGTFPGFGQQGKGASEIDTLTLKDLMNIKLTVASVKELTPRESPGIVSYITAEDIRKSGAKDLMDILKFVPGFEFGADVEGVVGLGIRGNWAHEGKVVLLIDGIEMNETLYSTLQFGNHYPVDNIERIEIIRGPGSAMYGGFAAYAVINVITRKARNHHETNVSATASAASEGISHSGFSVFHAMNGQKVNSGLTLSGYKAERSQETYTDVSGSSYSMHNNSGLKNLYLNGYLNIGKTKMQVITDQYHTESKDEYIHIVPEKSKVDFNNFYAAIQHEIKAGKNWKIVPKTNISTQQPWRNTPQDMNTEGVPLNTVTTRINAQVNADGHINDNLNLLAGFQYFHDRSVDKLNGVFSKTGTNQFRYNNSALYMQGLYNINNWNIIAGVRANYNSEFDATLTPRLGVTYVKDKWHLKALYNKSFRSPSTKNLDLANVIYPEQTSVAELETGVALGHSMYFTANFFKIITKDPIVYYFDTLANDDAYTNMARTGSIGTEVSIIYKGKNSKIETNISLYGQDNSDQLSAYKVPNSNENLGLAKTKFNFRYQYNVTKNLSITFTALYQSKKYAITHLDPITEEAVYTRMPSLLLCNIFTEYQFKNVKGLGFSAGISNILDQAQWYVQPYNSNHAPLPGMGREISLKLFYRNF